MLEAPPTGRPAPPLLVFDGDCGICTRLAGLAQRWIQPQRGTVVAAQWIDVAHYGLTAEQCREALQFVDRHGRTFAAQDAVARLLLSSRPWWRPAGVVLLLPGVRQVAGVVYRWVARNRYRLPGGSPACALTGPAAQGGVDATPDPGLPHLTGDQGRTVESPRVGRS